MAHRKKTIPLSLSILKFSFLFVVLLIILAPFVWTFITSIKPTQAEIYVYPILYWPSVPSLINYINMFSKSNFGVYMANSFIVSIISAFLAITLGLLPGYVVARFRFKLKGAILFLFLFTQMIPMFIMLAPLYGILSSMHLINTRWVLIILYTNMMIPFCMVTLRGFFQNIPPSLEEAAQIDGCGRLRALWKVVLPIMLPGIAATFIFSFVNSWNELFAANMFIDVDSLRTIPVALNALILKYDIKWGEMAAGTIMAIIPTIALFGFAQKYMAEGLTAGAVKG